MNDSIVNDYPITTITRKSSFSAPAVSVHWRTALGVCFEVPWYLANRHSETRPAAEKDTPMHPSFTTTSIEYAHDVYLNVVENWRIDEYLNDTAVFDPKTRRWLFSAEPVEKEGLVKSVHDIISSIVSRFVTHAHAGVDRRVVNVCGLQGNAARDEDGCPPYSDLVIRASGPSFESPVPNKNSGAKNGSRIVSFTNTAMCIAVKLDSAMGTARSNVEEMEKCARRIFASQPNRLYVRCLVVTERHVRMIHFDRAGAQATPLIDIHQHPATFVRLVVGPSSTDERIIGFDDSIQWKIAGDRKAQGTVTTTARDGTVKAYPIIDQITTPQATYLGRGTTCWRVRDPETSEELVIKDSWGPHDRPSEHEVLRLFHDIPGVVDMVSYETKRGETKNYRCASTVGQYSNRVCMRIVMKSYGKSVEFFTSALQLLCAIRDAIAGHERLLAEDLKILHRDVSHNNILIGADGAEEGRRGILIDLDIAFRATDKQQTTAVDYNVGTRIFQSINVLHSHAPQHKLPPHDYLDDLESFFYVVAYIFLIHRPDGSRVSGEEQGPAIVAKWDNDDPSVAFLHKDGIFGGSADGSNALKIVERTWGPVCTRFYKKFRTWMSDIMYDKCKLVKAGKFGDDDQHDDDEEEDEEDDDDDEDEDVDVDEEDKEENVETLKTFLSRRADHYAQVLAIFDEAIEALQRSSSEDVPSTTYPVHKPVGTPQASPSNRASVIPPSTKAVPPSEAETAEASPPPSPPDNSTVDAAPPVETTISTPSSSLEPPAPTTPPLTAPAALAVYANPSSHRLKRPSEDAAHPDSPPSKGRRIDEAPSVTHQ